MEEKKELQLTSLTDLENYAEGKIVQLPDFAEGQPFIARIKRPSLLALSKSGRIPNTLLSAAEQLFQKGRLEQGNKKSNLLEEMYDVCKIVCEASLLEPTLEEIESAGVELSDQHLMTIFNYSQVGVKALSNFR